MTTRRTIVVGLFAAMLVVAALGAFHTRDDPPSMGRVLGETTTTVESGDILLAVHGENDTVLATLVDGTLRAVRTTNSIVSQIRTLADGSTAAWVEKTGTTSRTMLLDMRSGGAFIPVLTTSGTTLDALLPDGSGVAVTTGRSDYPQPVTALYPADGTALTRIPGIPERLRWSDDPSRFLRIGNGAFFLHELLPRGLTEGTLIAEGAYRDALFLNNVTIATVTTDGEQAHVAVRRLDDGEHITLADIDVSDDAVTLSRSWNGRYLLLNDGTNHTLVDVRTRTVSDLGMATSWQWGRSGTLYLVVRDGDHDVLRGVWPVDGSADDILTADSILL